MQPSFTRYTKLTMTIIKDSSLVVANKNSHMYLCTCTVVSSLKYILAQKMEQTSIFYYKGNK